MYCMHNHHPENSSANLHDPDNRVVIHFQPNESFTKAVCVLHVVCPTVLHSINLYTCLQHNLHRPVCITKFNNWDFGAGG